MKHKKIKHKKSIKGAGIKDVLISGVNKLAKIGNYLESNKESIKKIRKFVTPLASAVLASSGHPEFIAPLQWANAKMEMLGYGNSTHTKMQQPSFRNPF